MDALEQARAEIDEVDAQLAALFERRMAAVLQVAEYKRAHGLPIFDAAREAAVLEKAAARIHAPALRPYYKDHVQNMMDVAKQYEALILGQNRAAYQGVEGAFAHIALRALFPHAEAVSCPTWDEVFAAVERGDAAHGVVPFENSHAGDVSAVLDLCYNHPDLWVVDVYDLPISQNLLVLPGTQLAEIRSVFAPTAVQAQDEQLRQYLPAVNVNMSAWTTPAPEPTPTPTPEPTPEPTPTPTPEPTQSPQLQAALAAREAFLNEQAVYSGYAVPTNVSYAVSELPFAHTSPVAGYTSSGFGYRLHPLENKVKFHYGTDFAANSGMAVCAFADGTVLAAGQDDGYGNYVKIRHADGYTTLYGHCSKLLVRAGETVTAGQEIALVGATGKATGPHLHFELMHDGYYCNPEFYLAAV